MDSHTPMIDSLGIVGWGVGGLEGGTAALGEAVSMLIPEVVGVHPHGSAASGYNRDRRRAHDHADIAHARSHRHIRRILRAGRRCSTVQERSTLSNMTPEYGATMGFFAIDAETLRYLRLTGRSEQQVALVEAYARAQGLWRDAATAIPSYTRVVDIDLSTVEASLAGPRRPHERVPLPEAPQAFRAAYPSESLRKKRS